MKVTIKYVPHPQPKKALDLWAKLILKGILEEQKQRKGE